eukprot:11876863-Karenia_brevis.AAC.1
MDHRANAAKGPWGQRTMGTKRVQGPKGPTRDQRDQGTKEPRDQRTTGPMDQGAKGPMGQGTKGPREQ